MFDHAYKQRYRVASAPPGDDVPDWMVSAPTVDELARRLGVAPEGLVATVERFNDYAAQGYDPDFGRGESAYDTWNGDRSRPGRRPRSSRSTRRPTTRSPLHSGALGTKGGPAPTPTPGSWTSTVR